MQHWSFDISSQTDWDLWSVLCLLATAVLLSYALTRPMGRSRSGRASLCLVAAGVAGTAAVLIVPSLRNATVGFAWTFLLLTLLSVVFYLSLLDRLPPRRVVLLVCLRIAALASLVPMLFEPVLRYTRIAEPVRPLLLLVDASGSMSFPDLQNGPTRLQAVWQALQPQLGRLGRHFVPKVYTFSSEATPLERPDRLASAVAVGTGTDLVAGVRQSLSQSGDDDAVVVLFSDGIDNTNPDAPEAIATLRRPVHTVAVGSDRAESAAVANIAVAEVRTDDDLAVGHASKVTAIVRSTALPSRAIDVKLAEVDTAGKPIAEPRTQQLVLQSTAQGQEVSFTFTPSRAGVQRLAVWVDPAAGERSTDDNRQELQTLASDPGIRVLYIEGRLRPEFRDLRRLLQSDPNVEVATLLRVRENTFVAAGTVNRQPLPPRLPTDDEWNAFDVVLLGDLDASFLSASNQGAIERAVAGGKGLLMVGGEKSFGPGGYAGTVIEKALPVLVGPVNSGQESARFVPRLSGEGAAHPAMEGLTPYFGVDATPPVTPVPPLNGNVVVSGESAGAQVLLTHPGKAGPDGKPQIVLAVQRYGQGRAAAFTAHSTYLWALPMHGLGQDSPYNRLWGQLIRWLAGADVRSRQRGPGVDALLSRDVYHPGETVRLRAMVRDRQGDATRFAQVSARLRQQPGDGSAEQVLTLNPVDGRNGMYELAVPPAGKGRYVATIVATKDGQELGQSSVAYTVTPPADEMQQLAADRTLLRRIAAETRGGSYELDRLPELVDTLVQSAGSPRAEGITVRVGSITHLVAAAFGRQPQWPRQYDLPVQGLVVTLLLTLEWGLRRRWQLT